MLWTKLNQPYLDPIATPNIKRGIVIKIEIPDKLIKFLLYFIVLNNIGCWNWGSFDLVSWWSDCSIVTCSIESTSFISMLCAWVLLSGFGMILDLGILIMALVWLYFFTKSIGKLINIKARQMMMIIQSFLEKKVEF